MMYRLLFMLGLLAAPALGQLQFYTLSGTNDVQTPVGTSLDLGNRAVGDPTPTRLRLRNIGSTNISLSVLKLSGVGFSMTGEVPLPFVMTPGTNVDFAILFNPTGPGAYSASLTVNTTAYLVSATAYATAQVGVRDAGSTTVLAAGSPYDFGQIEAGTSVVKHFVIRNASTAPVSINTIALSGGSFTWSNAPKAPLALAIQQEISFDITCAPLLAGVQQGQLIVDNLTFPLAALATAPALPAISLSSDTSAITNAQQVRISINLASTSKTSGSGTLQVEMLPNIAGLPDDGAIQFPASSSRTIAFQIRAGDTKAQFNGQPYAILQTGTIAGTLRLTAAIAGQQQQLLLPIASAVPYLSNATTGHTDSSVSVQITGYDNTRSLTALTFTFYDVTGSVMPGGTIVVDAASSFQQYFTTTTAGGLFQLQAVFPVSGTVSGIGSVAVGLTSNAGTKRTEQIRF